MAFFRRRARRDGEHLWTLAAGEFHGHPAFVRTKVTRRDRSRPIKVTVKLGIAEPDQDGLPGPAESDVLGEIEEVLFDELEQHGAELVLVMTANYAREFIAYCSTHDWLPDWGPTVLSRWGEGRPGTGVDAVIEGDWATYKAFAVK